MADCQEYMEDMSQTDTSEYFPCPWCGSIPEEFSRWEDDGLARRFFGCGNRDCPVKPAVDITMLGLKTGTFLWQKGRDESSSK